MRKRVETLNFVQIISNFGLIISLILYLFSKNNIVLGLYWIFLELAIIGNVWFLSKWLKTGLNLDKNKSNHIHNELDNISITLIVIYTLVFLAIVFLQNINVLSNDNVYVIILMFIFTIFLEISLYILEEKAYNETKKLVNKSKK